MTPLRLATPAPPTAVERTPPPTAGEDAATRAFRAPELPAAKCAPAPQATSPAPTRPVIPATSRTVEPLDAERVRLHMTVSRRFLAKLEETKDALSHARPGASAEEVLEACMDVLLAQHARRKGIVEKPRNTVRPGTSNAIPAAVKRDVWRRAGGRCEWPLDGGGVCASTLRLEFDHVVPRALGGPSTFHNVRVLCRGS